MCALIVARVTGDPCWVRVRVRISMGYLVIHAATAMHLPAFTATTS